jgi:hypothetical protein
MTQKSIANKKLESSKTTSSIKENLCFVISPIGSDGSSAYTKFKEILEYIIKPAFNESGFKYTVIRADDIDRAGSFIKDILESIYSAHLVIADLTGQNPNVFYELGVRHSLRPRTILISQNLDDIPSDLREYRTIIYGTSAKEAAAFKEKIKKFLTEIKQEPDRPDNPVLDRLGSVIENKLSQVEEERDTLKAEIAKLLSGARSTPYPHTSHPDIRKRFDRILNLKNAEKQGVLGGSFTKGEESFKLPYGQGNFALYFLKNGKTIEGFWYVSIQDRAMDINEELSDVRVLLENCSKGQNVKCDFIVVTISDMPNKKEIQTKFEKIKSFIGPTHQKNFTLHLLDPAELLTWEEKLGLKI